jgi:hypothetical protein
MQHLSGLWGEIVAWAAILTAVAALASLIVRIDRRRPDARRTEAAVAEAPSTEGALDRQREWALVVRRAGEGLSRGAELAALQADTERKIASAEHAYNRLVADCALLCGLSAAAPAAADRAVQIVGRPETPPPSASGEPTKPAERQPLAA